jgi:hypothetical protein
MRAVGLISRLIRCFLFLGLLCTFGARAAPPTSAPVSSPLRQAVARAADAQDDLALSRALEELAGENLPQSLAMAHRLLTAGVPHQRPVGLLHLIRHAGARQLAAVASRLSMNDYHEARRLLVRSIGAAGDVGDVGDEEAVNLVAPFLRDQDYLVRAAAVGAIADRGRPEAASLFFNPLPPLSDYSVIGGSGEDHLESIAIHGALRTLWGTRPASSQELMGYLRNPRARVAATQRASLAILPTLDGHLSTPSFEVRCQPAPQVLASLQARLQLRTPEDWRQFGVAMEAAADKARAVAGPIFGGTARAPVTRLNLANATTVAGTGGTSQGYSGFGGDGFITLNVDRLATGSWETLLRHEYTHVLHRGQFLGQPRWLEEGLACSVSESPEASDFATMRGHQSLLLLRQPLRTGAFTVLVTWTTGTVTNADESRQYKLAHLAVDYLRFGVPTAPNQRLFYLMGAFHRGVAPAAALEQTYGMTLRQLDQDLLRWLSTLSQSERE